MGRHIEQIKAGSALERARGNKLRKYPSPDSDGDRLYPLASPNCSPSFKIEADETIFAIGSCFARNVEKSLESAGKRVLSREFQLGLIGESLGEAGNFFNKYSIQSVTNEVRWALERDTFPGADLLYPAGKGSYCDCQLGMAKLDFEIDEILDFRHRYLDVVKHVATADVIILTLGYVETWYDLHLNLYLNVAPPVQLVKLHPDRFEFRVLSYSDVLDGLNELFNLLQRHRVKPLKMLVTVSPVPLLSTFRDMDILVANSYSKAVQRAALDEFLIGKTGVDYFPSYEFVTLSNPTVAWSRGDYRHVSPDVVTRIMANVLSNYIAEHSDEAERPKSEMSQEELLSSLRMMVKLEEHQAGADLVQANRQASNTNPDILLFEAACLRNLNRLDDSWAALRRAVDLAPDRPAPLERLIMMCRPLKKYGDARALLAEHATRFPNRPDFREKMHWI